MAVRGSWSHHAAKIQVETTALNQERILQEPDSGGTNEHFAEPPEDEFPEGDDVSGDDVGGDECAGAAEGDDDGEWWGRPGGDRCGAAQVWLDDEEVQWRQLLQKRTVQEERCNHKQNTRARPTLGAGKARGQQLLRCRRSSRRSLPELQEERAIKKH
jgi:hypothetical protein